nr:hypothetical protein [Tanacetum cinerariifolium]
MPRKSFVTLADHLHEAMTDSLPIMVDKHIKDQVEKQVPEQVRNQVPVYVAEGLILERQKTKEEMKKMIAKAILQEHDPQWQQQDISIWLALQMKFERLQVPQTTCRTPAICPRDQDDPYDDAHPEGEKSVKRQKTSEYETYVSGESSSRHDNEHEQDDDEILTKQVSQDNGRGPEKIVLSLHKFPVVVFNDDDIKERTSRWVNKCVKKFNPYARYGFEHWKNPHAKIFYIRKHKETEKPKEIIPRRANDCIVSITEPDFKNLNKNDIEDMHLLIMNEKVNLTAPTLSFPEVEKHEMLSIIYEPVHGIIYKNSKKEKRVMRRSKIHKFCNATLNKVLEGLKSYNNNVRYGYNQRDLTKDEVEYLKLFEEEIKDRLKYRRHMRR